MLISSFPPLYRVLQYEHDQRLRLEEMVETLAKQHSSLERQARKNVCATSTSSALNAAEPTRKPSATHQGETAPVGHAAPPPSDAAAATGATAVSSDTESGGVSASSFSASAQPNAASSNAASEDDDDEFFDVLEEAEEFNIPLRFGPSAHQRSGSAVSAASAASTAAPGEGPEDVSSTESDVEEGRVVTIRTKTKKTTSASPIPHGGSNNNNNNADATDAVAVNGVVVAVGGDQETKQKPARIRRSAVKPKPNYPLNLWGIMKNCIGKELSKIPMPVNFSEPLSMLQRLTEDLEYSEILDQAATMKDSRQQLAYIAAFTVSSYATTTVRTTKPFNPLLGETYECDRTDDRGWKLITEQVSHHPPAAAQHVESDQWELWQEFTMSSKFRGKYLQIIPLGLTHLRFKESGNHYTWRKGECWERVSGESSFPAVQLT